MKGALRIIYPPQCLDCGRGVAGDGALCPDCWRDTQFVTGMACPCCGAPLPEGEVSEAAETPCDDCLQTPRPWRQGRAAMVYGGTGRRLVLALKHGDRPDLAPPLAGWLSRAATPLLTPDTVVVPVPVHWRRLVRRRYNQAELLAHQLARTHGLTHVPDALFRSAYRAAQDHRTVEERFENIAGTIAANPRRASRIAARPVLLVDDVMTSGATLAASTEALIAIGSGPVSVAVLARAVKTH